MFSSDTDIIVRPGEHGEHCAEEMDSEHDLELLPRDVGQLHLDHGEAEGEALLRGGGCPRLRYLARSLSSSSRRLSVLA